MLYFWLVKCVGDRNPREVIATWYEVSESESESEYLTGYTSIDIHQGQRVRELVPRSHQWCESSELSADDIADAVCLNRTWCVNSSISGLKEMWTLISSLHQDAKSAVKWQGHISEKVRVEQGVRLGEILSTDLY